MGSKLSKEGIFQEMKEHCLSKEGATEDRPWGDIAWKVKNKAFVFTSEGSARYTLKSTLDKQAALTMHPQISVAAYVGRYGWISMEVIDEDTLALAKDLADESYDLVGKPKKKTAKG
ncbi:MAG TPA: MmcQ/YjbR family DNA-binding protein [Fimbriimonadaceae bacterium]|jgi:predicted DNA-binding protein (MmcQ/YjbR family)